MTSRTRNTLILFTICSASQLAFSRESHDPFEIPTPKGVEIGADWIIEYSAIVEGGIDRTSGVRDLLTVDLTLDLATIADLDRTVLFAQFMSADPSKSGSAAAGDLQGYSNIEIDESIDAIYEAWVEHQFETIDLRLKIGKVDANSEFASIESASGFSNSSAGFSPSIFVLPTYPNPAFSINLFWSPNDSITLGYGFYDGASGPDGVPTGKLGPSSFLRDQRSNDWFHIVQMQIEWDRGGLSAGAWYHTGDFARFDGGTDSHAYGYFATISHSFLQEDDGNRNVTGFAQLGIADEAVSEFALQASAGIVIDSLIGSRPDDQLGLYASFADLSDDAAAGFARDELAVDLFYAIAVHPNLVIRPEIQYIINPSGSASVGNTVVLGCRMECSF